MRPVPCLYLILFIIFFIISLGLGYVSLNRFDPEIIQGLEDTKYYADIVRNGPGSTLNDQVRILVQGC